MMVLHGWMDGSFEERGKGKERGKAKHLLGRLGLGGGDSMSMIR